VAESGCEEPNRGNEPLPRRPAGYDRVVRIGVAVVVLSVAGCRSLLGIDDPLVQSDARGAGMHDASLIDARADAPFPHDTLPGLCLGQGADFTVCLATAPTSDLLVSSATQINTSDPSECDPGATVEGNDVCVRAFGSIDVNGTLTVFGGKPFVLVATGALNVADGAVVDVSSTAGPGAGADWTGCGAPGNGMPGNNGQGGGGGAGGSFGSRGGNGGAGADGISEGGLSAPGDLGATLHGGCGGGTGAPGAATPALAGNGGGAVYLVAGTSLIVSGTVNASGGGAQGGREPRGGGAGGGAGGMIALWGGQELQVLATAQVFANGGAGGGGADTTQDGPDGGAPTKADAGGKGTGLATGAGAGGDGASKNAPGSDGGRDSGGVGGGGAGGGTGVIRLVSSGAAISANAGVSPMPVNGP
jgi:hypothetical protein